MDEVKYLVIYLDNSCEAHFDNGDNSRIILSPCGTEFIYRIYANDNTIQSTYKYRTAYPLSMFTSKLSTILKIRNKYCDDRPFISPILLENNENSFWMSSENLTEAKWDIRDINLNLKNPIQIDYHNFFYVWKSSCKNAEFKLHFNRQIVNIKYPVKLPKSLDDEFEKKCDINETISKINKNNQNYVSKYLFKYTLNEQEFSVNNLPSIWQGLYQKLVEILSNQNNEKKCDQVSEEFICISFPEAIPLSCKSTHLHKFDNIETLSEPKIIYLNRTWYKLFYKNKSIEILCPAVQNNSNIKQNSESSPNDDELDSTQDFLISDSASGRYYTCYSLNKRTGNVEEIKICVENIPDFKTYIQKILSYSNILLKRIDSIKYISNYSSCYINKKIEEIEMDQSVLKINKSINNKQNDTNSNVSNDLETIRMDIRKQYYVNNVGHFKYLRNNTIVINFIDKVKLYMNENSITKYLNNDLKASFCLIYLPDNSEHEICLFELNAKGGIFEKYLNFLNQWLNWLIENKSLKNGSQYLNEISQEEENSTENYFNLQSHLSKLKLFNYSIEQNSNFIISNEKLKDTKTNDKIIKSDVLSQISVSNLLKENNQFLKSISK